MRRVALRGIRAHFLRFALAVLAVALGVAFVAGTFSLRTVLASTFEGIVQSSSTAQAYVRGAGEVAGSDVVTGAGGTVHAPVPGSLADAINAAQIPNVREAVADISGTVTLVGANGTAVMSSGAPTIAIPIKAGDPVASITSGALPVGKHEITLDQSSADRSGLTVGAATTIIIAGDIVDVTVTGIMDLGATMAGAVMVGFEPAVLEAAFAADGIVPTVSVYGVDGVSEADVTASVTQFLAANPDLDGASAAEVVTGETLRDEFRAGIDQILGFIQVFLLIFAAISLFVGGFLITNTFAMSVRERMREFALLRAIGASPVQVFVSILAQALVVGVIGSVVGIAAGLGLAAGLSALLAAMGMELGGAVTLTTQTVVVSLLIGTVVSVIAAAIPARRAALTAPVEAMRDTAPSEKGLRVRGIIGAILAALGVSAIVLAAVATTDDGSAIDGAGTYLGLGAVALVIGALMLAPVLARRVVTVLAVPFTLWGAPLGVLARGNVIRNPRRTASTAGALMIGMILVSASSVLAASTTASVIEIVNTDLKADFIVRAYTGIPDTVADSMAAAPTVEAMDPAYQGVTFVKGQTGPQYVIGIDSNLPKRAIEVHVVSGDLGALDRGEALVFKDAANANDWELGDTVTLGQDAGTASGTPSAGSAEHDVRIGAIVTSDPFAGAQMFLPQDVFDKVVPPKLTELTSLFITGADGAALEDVRADLAAIAKPYFVISVMNADELASDIADQVNGLLAVIYALLGLSVLIAVLGIVNTLALSIAERTREIALLRAVGLGRLQLSTIIAIESVLTAVFGTILGVAVGVGISMALPSVFAEQGMTTLVIPWATLGGMVALAAVIGVIASVWPAITASRMPVLDGLAAD